MKREIVISRIILPLFVLGALAAPAMATPFVINPTWDSSITSLSNAAAIEASILSVIATYQATFRDPITVNITFANMTSGLGQSAFNLYDVGYSTYRAALSTDSTSADDTTALAHLANTANNPVTNNTEMLIKSATQKALGLLAGNAAGSDGTISLNTSIMNINRVVAQNGSFYDLQAVAMHEIDEILGLGSTLGLGVPSPFDTYPSPEDLFRYNGSGARSYTTSSSATAFFSIDGTTNLAQFNQSSGGDYGDWVTSGGPKVQDAFGTPGSQPNLGVEIRALDVIGYTLASPEPATWFLLVTGLVAGVWFKRRQVAPQPQPVPARYNAGK